MDLIAEKRRCLITDVITDVSINEGISQVNRLSRTGVIFMKDGRSNSR